MQERVGVGILTISHNILKEDIYFDILKIFEVSLHHYESLCVVPLSRASKMSVFYTEC